MPKQYTYTPILRNRQVEFRSIHNVFDARPDFSRVIVPLFEIIQDKQRSNSSKTFVDDIGDFIANHPDAQVIVDIARHTPTSSMAPAVRTFFVTTSRDPDAVQDRYKALLAACASVLPTVSTNVSAPDFAQYGSDIDWFHEAHPDRHIVYRVPVQMTDEIAPLLRDRMRRDDIALLDIGDAQDSTSGPIKRACAALRDIAKNAGARLVIADDPRPQSLYNKNLVSGKPIYSIGTSLKRRYRSDELLADGFGDYAGITSAFPTTGGTISPAAVFYDPAADSFVGFRGNSSELSAFTKIAQGIMQSKEWAALSQEHRDNCPGCKEIEGCSHPEGAHGNQATWKQFTMEHYLYCMGEFMLKENGS